MILEYFNKGPGSGNERKHKTIELIKNTIGFDRNRHLENKILKNIVMKMSDLTKTENKIKVEIDVVNFY